VFQGNTVLNNSHTTEEQHNCTTWFHAIVQSVPPSNHKLFMMVLYSRLSHKYTSRSHNAKDTHLKEIKLQNIFNSKDLKNYCEWRQKYSFHLRNSHDQENSIAHGVGKVVTTTTCQI
jgi:hypothetical protein